MLACLAGSNTFLDPVASMCVFDHAAGGKKFPSCAENVASGSHGDACVESALEQRLDPGFLSHILQGAVLGRGLLQSAQCSSWQG